MRKVTKTVYVAMDGTEWPDAESARTRDMQINFIRTNMDKLKPPRQLKNNEYIQQDATTVSHVKNALTMMMEHASLDSFQLLSQCWCRILRIDKCGREWQQEWYVEHTPSDAVCVG